MRRGLLLVFALLLLVLAVTAIVRDRAAGARADTLALNDSAARRDSLPAEDPPCLASRIGLPCR